MTPPQSSNIGTKQKALEINLDPKIYGTFAEIGAGQDVAANFFKAGASSGTIAKTMSAYDMTFSDAIYGAEQKKRYVSENRLLKMLDKDGNFTYSEIRIVKFDSKAGFTIAPNPAKNVVYVFTKNHPQTSHC